MSLRNFGLGGIRDFSFVGGLCRFNYWGAVSQWRHGLLEEQCGGTRSWILIQRKKGSENFVDRAGFCEQISLYEVNSELAYGP